MPGGAMSGLTTYLFGWIAFSPVLAPIPPAPLPSPLEKPAVGIRADTGTCVVTEVYPDMPAGKAGIRANDRIVRIGSFHPTDFNQVVSQITTYRPGAMIELEVDRNGERKVFKLKLVPRPADYGSRIPGYPPPINPDD